LRLLGEHLEGEACARIAVKEHGMPFWVDVAHGQKTGAFLDQRENRLRVRSMAKGKRVLNLFSYAGGFSMAAALGGSTRVTSVDIAAKAHATARDSFKLAGLDPSPHAFVSADAFEFLKQAHAKKETWDLIICDPPSFAPNERSKDRALASYRRLHHACASVLAEGGTLCAASCSSHVAQEDFLQTLDPRTLLQRNLKLLAAYGPPEDHPTLPEFPEGRYLKFMVLG
jgi:23S rRNA (cytosine1962-C5)-methyltransferase